MKGSLGKMMEKIKTKKKKAVLAGIGLVVCCAIAGVLIAQNEKPETVILKSDQAVLTVSEGTSQEVEKNLKDLSVDYSTVGKNQYVVNTKDTKKIQKSLNSIKGVEATFAEDQPFLLMGNQKDAKESKKKTDEKEIDKEETVDINDIELEEDLPEGKTWRELADERNQKLVAVIDSQVDHYAIHNENFTDMDEAVSYNHGTLTAHTIYQESENKAMILGLKAFAENGTGYMSDVMEAVEYARQQKVDIINLSFTTDKINEVKPLETLLQQCMDEGIQVVVAAGNFDQDIKYFSPANIDGVISVGALDEDGKRAAFSNYGDVTYYVKSPSTSQAAALVSGMLARGDDMKDVKTGDDIQVKEEENKEHLDIFENNEQGDFVTQAATQNITLSSGNTVTWYVSNITANSVGVAVAVGDGTWNLGYAVNGGVYVYTVDFHNAEPKSGYAIDYYTLDGSISYGQFPSRDGRVTPGFSFVPNFTRMTTLTATTHKTAKLEHKVHYNLNGGSWNTSAISNPNGYKIIEDGNYSIQWGYNSAYYIHTIYDNAQATGIHLYNNSTNANSIWYFERYQNTPYYFIVGDNGWDLASYGSDRVDEASQVNDSGRNNHLWAIEELSNGNIALKNVGTGRYIYSHYATAGNGNSIGLWGNHDGTDCQWKLVKRYTGTSAYRKKLYGNTFFVNQKTPVKPGYIFQGWASRPEWDTRAKSVSINGRTIDRYFIQPIANNRFEVMVHTTDSRITQVSVPTWPDVGGQSEYLTWFTLGRGNWTRDGQDFNWGAQIAIPEKISHYSMHIYTGINGAWEEALASSGLDSVWMIGEQYTFDTNTEGTMYATWRKDDTQYQQTVKVRFENADGSFTSYQQAYQQTVKAGTTFTWEYPESSIYQSASISEKVTGTKTHNVTIYRKKGKIDINSVIDGVTDYSGTGGTIDLYINGKLVYNDVSDAFIEARVGSTWEVKDFKPSTGYYGIGMNADSGKVSEAKPYPVNKILQKEQYVTYNTQGGTLPNVSSNPNGYKIIKNGYYFIQSALDSNKHFHSYGHGTTDTTKIVSFDGASKPAYQTQWYFQRYKNTPYYYIIHKESGKAIDLSGDMSGITNTSSIELYTQLDGGNDSDFLWAIKDTGNGTVALVNKYNNRVIEIPNSNTSNGVELKQNSYTGGNNQKWKLISVDTGDYPTQRNVASTKFMINQTAPVRNGYTFVSWNTKANGSGTSYAPGATLPTNFNGTLYAQWKAANATQTIRVRYQNADGTFGNYQQAYQKDYAIGSTFTWEYAGNATYKPAKVSYTVTGNKSTDVTIYRKEYKLKVIQRLNGKNLTAPNFVGNFDFYFENKLYSDNAAAVDTTVLAGQSYEIKNIQANAGYSYKSATPGLKGTVSSNLTVYLDFETNSYTATFDANGGSTPNPKTIKKKYGEALGTLPTTSRTGYTFQGWYTAKTGGTKISTTTKMPSNNVTYYAQWKPITYKVHYNGNGSTANNPGSVAQMDDSVHTYDVKKALSKNQYEKIGWDFVGWNTKADGSGTSYKDGQEVVNLASKQDAVVQLYAQWEPSTFRVVFDPNGGETPTPFSEKEGEQNKPIGEMPTTKRKGYTFLGWFDSKNADAKKVDENTIIRNKLTTVYAHWELNSYSITYDYDGGTPVSNPTSYNVDTNTFTLKNPTRTGYRFDGWTGSNGTTPQTTVTIKKGTTGDLSYTANWTPIFYTVEYNGNGATGGSTASSSHTYDKPKQLTKNGFTKSNNMFVQWNTKPDGSGVAYRDQEVVENLTTTNGATVTLYAIWEIKEVTLTFDPTGGSEVPPIIRFAGDKMGTLPETERKGYTFLGWYTERTGGTKLSSSSTVPAQNRTYYAHWETIDYSITYDLNGGKVSGNPDSYTVESNITLKNPTKTGHTFLGWTGTELNGLTKNVTIPKGSTGDRHYTANWKAHTYTIRYNGNGSTSGSTATSTHTYGVAKNLTENGFRRTGYTFAGWNTKADGSGTSYKNAQSVKNLTSSDGAVVNLYACWYVNTYTVTFNPNMDASSNTVTIFAGTRDETLHRADGSTYTDKSGGTRTKYVLTFNKADHEKGLLSVTIKGLYGALDGTIRKVESTKTSIVDFDPSIATKVITFDPNGGTCEIESARFTVNSKLNSLPTPQREGYTFDGWFTAPDGGTRVTTSTPLGEEDRTVYAHWTAKTYTITYHGNNGSYNGKETYEDTVQWGVDYEVSTNFFTRSGWKFIGWNTKADGTGKDWTGKINQTEAWRVDSDVTLYAQWSK